MKRPTFSRRPLPTIPRTSLRLGPHSPHPFTGELRTLGVAKPTGGLSTEIAAKGFGGGSRIAAAMRRLS